MKYTVSTMIFDSLKEAEEQVQEWHQDGTLKEDTKVMEITGITYIPILKLKKEKNAL